MGTIKKIVIVCLSLLFIANLISKSGQNLINPQTCKTVGVYAKGENLETVFGRAFNHGFAYEIFDVVPDIVASFSGTEVIGEFFNTTLNNFNINNFCEEFGAVVIKTCQVGTSFNIYAYSPNLPYRLTGQNFNLQISIDGNNVCVASPIILGSF